MTQLNVSATLETDVCVIIVTYNGALWIEKCIESLMRSVMPLDIIVVDNASIDDTLSLVQRYPKVIEIKLSKNHGFGAANNIGMEHAYRLGYKFIYLANQDTWIYPESIRVLVDAMREDPAYAILSPIHINGLGSSLDFKFSLYVAPPRCSLISDLYLDQVKKIYEVPFVNAAAWLLSRQCIAQVGGFNPSFFHYGEDENYVARLKFHGFKLGIVPQAKIHHERENRSDNPYFMHKELYRRAIVGKMSNPIKTFSLLQEGLELSFGLVVCLLCMRLRQCVEIVQSLWILLTLNTSKIKSNRLTSINDRSAFLHIESPPDSAIR